MNLFEGRAILCQLSNILIFMRDARARLQTYDDEGFELSQLNFDRY